jgi:hypothetical protein
MGDKLTDVMVKWAREFTGVAVNEVATAQGGPAASSGPQTGSVQTPSGTFHYLKRVEAKVEPVITEASNKISEATDNYSELISASGSLTALEEKYADMDDSSLIEEIHRYTDDKLRDEAGASRGAQIQAEGLKTTLAHIGNELQAAQQGMAIMNKEISARDLHERGAVLLKLGREQEERFAAPLKLVTRVVGLIDAKETIAADPSKALPWIKPALELLDGLLTIESEFTRQGMELEAEANKLDLAVFADRSKLARMAVFNLTKEVPKWKDLVEQADHDLAQKRGVADDGYDKKSSKGRGKFRFADLKKGVELCAQVRHFAQETSAPAHNARILLVGLKRLQGDYEKWMANAGKDGGVFDALLESCRTLYNDADPKIGWSNTLSKKFQALYDKAQNMMADAPGH